MRNTGRAGKTQRKAAQAADGQQREALRLHGIAATAGYGDLARTYATELSVVRGRIAAGGAA